MTQSLVVQAPYRRIRHPELVPVIINRDERTNYDIMSQSLIMPPYRRTRHTDLIPVMPNKEPTNKANLDVKNRQHLQHNFYVKAPKRAFSMTRLDQLARPRQRYLEEALKLRASVTKENLCSSAVRPLSSMSLASKQQTQSIVPKSSNTSTASNNSSSSGTILLRQRTSARKRPISYAGYSLNQSLNNANNKELNNSDLSSTATFSKSSAKTRPFRSVINNNSKNLTNLSSMNQNRNLMVSSIDGSMMISTLSNYHNNKPIPPRKPAHIKAVSAARKLAKQQQPDQTETDQIKKSESTSRISNKLESNNSKEKMKKSVTNPEKITELFNETLNLNDEKQDKKVIRIKSEDRSCDNLKSELLETMSNNTFIVENESTADDQVNLNQLIDLNDEQESNLNKLDQENEISKRQEEEESQKQILLENEEMERKAQEEKRRLAREEKERELERKAKEKIEKARLEMEERLRKDEQERIERKKRLDAIMSRTRKNPGNSTNNNKVTSPNTENVQTTAQQTSSPSDVNNRKKFEEQQDEHNESSSNPDVVEDAIKSI